MSKLSGTRKRLAALMIGLSAAGLLGATVSAPAYAQPREPFEGYKDWYDDGNWVHGKVYYEDGMPFIISLCYSSASGNIYNCPRWL